MPLSPPVRMPLLSLLAILAGTGPGPACAANGDLSGLERAWHGCVRETYAAQPAGQSRAASELSALDACRAHEDRYVAALMAARIGGDRPPGARVRAWAATMAASLVDPVTAWIQALRR
ncbi:hypothetical protein [Methylobacterium sp. NEAU K]|uniref:hypothetical protein n=1 Tax=Methylobacterium sp. NEAU K TaxID=3064946 RepID=UPI00273347C8|nr:hypothetical protein [Methylobacterium sp. NEAU K]MDP4005688.1 hypothetical protein [Methylobacterium sp. NEAU K]